MTNDLSYDKVIQGPIKALHKHKKDIWRILCFSSKIYFFLYNLNLYYYPYFTNEYNFSSFSNFIV